MKKGIGIVTIALSLLFCGGAARADEWWSEKEAIPAFTPVTVTSTGSAKLQVQQGKKDKLKADCTLSQTSVVENLLVEATDEVTSTLSCEPGSCTVEPGTWHGVLEGPGDPFVIRFSEASMSVTCGSASLGVLTGTLTPKFGDGDCPPPVDNDDVDETMKYQGSSTGELSGGGWTVSLSGSQKLGPGKPDRIQGALSIGEPCEGGNEKE